MTANFKNRTLFVADNLHILRGMNSGSVDLIATDPPFNTKRQFNAPLGSSAAKARFDDRWVWDDVAGEWSDLLGSDVPAIRELIEAAVVIEGGTVDRRTGEIDTGRVKNSVAAFLCWMAPRLIEMRRVLKPTGSIYLHCDDTAGAYLRLLMDAVFGRARYRNEIVWKRQSGNNAGKNYGRIADRILYYTAAGAFTWNQPYASLSEAQAKRYRYREADGRRYKVENLTSPGPTKGGPIPWRGTTPKYGWRHSLEQREEWWAEGRIKCKKDGTPRLDGRKSYLDEHPGAKVPNIWTDILRVGNTASERTGWPTQKPLKLYRRIIRASSNEGDVVLDPFAGCATTCVAAQQLGRKWVGIDIDPMAETVTEERLWSEAGLENEEVPVTVRKSLRRTDIPRVTKEKLRLSLYQRQGHRCANPYCDSEGLRVVDLELDHIIPAVRGGYDGVLNRIGLCANCNRRKGRKAWGLFLHEERAGQPHPPRR